MNAPLPAEATATVQPAELALQANILDKFAQELTRLGLVGEDRAAKLVYLILTTRLFDKPVSAAIKGPSSGGKSFLVASVLRFFPKSARYEVTAMSERALAYGKEPLSHRFLVIYEAAGIKGETFNYFVRSLLSEGRLVYETTVKTPRGDDFGTKTIRREGPTGLLLTTTKVKLHPENETRLFSIPINDTKSETGAVLRSLAADRNDQKTHVDPVWLEFQEWLFQHGEHRVGIPYAERLAQLVEPSAVRLRRDFGAILSLIKANAVVHQANRGRDDHGRTIATLEDYAVVRNLVADLVSQGVGASVPPTVRETVAAVLQVGARRYSDVAYWDQTGPNLIQVAQALSIDKSAASRRVGQAIELGYLVNLEHRKGRPLRLALGEPLPDEDSDILPSPDDPRLTGNAVGPSSNDGERHCSHDTAVRNADSAEVA